MLKSEFREAAEEVFSELLPKVKAFDRYVAITELMLDLEVRGLEFEDDEQDYSSEDDES